MAGPIVQGVMPQQEPLIQPFYSPPFVDNTVTALTYAFGVGLQGEVRPHVQVAVGYEFADWGKNNLGLANGQTTQSRLGASNLYVNELQFSILYTV